MDTDHQPGLRVALKPDFSQIEADTAQIASNERFALFYPEKRPFFLEGRDLLSSPLQWLYSSSTPLQAIYTRTITSPDRGARATGRFGQTSYTALVSNDSGGGSVVFPGPTESSTAPQDFRSEVFLGRVRRDFGGSFVSLITTNRWIDGGGENHVFGPDFQWRPNPRDTVTGELLLSDSKTPRKPELAQEWDGRSLSGQAGEIRWLHRTRTYDWVGDYKDVGAEFRADKGFVPQAGFREGHAEAGRTFWPRGLLTRLRPFGLFAESVDRDGGLLSRQVAMGLGFSGAHDSVGRVRLSLDRVLTGPVVLPRTQVVFDISASPSRWFTGVEVFGAVGDAIDFDNHRTGTGADLGAFSSIQATRHLELRLNWGLRYLDVTDLGGGRRHLFTAQVDRVRATYALSRRALVRVVAQYVQTRRDPALYEVAVKPRDAALDVSGLFAYKLNWQTVLFAGYGDARVVADDDRLEPQHRELFLKISYAFQR